VKYLIITPVHNEEKHLTTYIESVINQELKPTQFVLVDDNSSDSSSSLIKSYCEKFEWIKYLYHPSEAKKSQGAKIIHAFNYGLTNSSLEGIDIVSKIDADLKLPPEYFKKVIETFSNNQKIGLAGGYILEKEQGKWKRQKQGNYHIRGALKSYRVECFKDIDGLMPVLGWDGIDIMKSYYNGWSSHVIEIGVKHYRPASSNYDTPLLNYKRGIANYKLGGNLFLAIIRSIVKSMHPPYIKSGYNFLLGYLHCYWNNEERLVSDDLAFFINSFHFKRLLKLSRYQ
jgi:glycosyltransferase involved in cell wall biosynthesis